MNETRKTFKCPAALVVAAATALAVNGHAFAVVTATNLLFDVELLELDLSGGPFPMPLANDPGNLLGDSIEGYGFVDSQVNVTLSSQRAVSPGPPSTGSGCPMPWPFISGIIPFTACSSRVRWISRPPWSAPTETSSAPWPMKPSHRDWPGSTALG